MREKSFLSLGAEGFSKLWYSEWGELPSCSRTLVCVHGLTGSAADFKFVGEFLSACGIRVLALDLPGRGRSEFLQDPTEYTHTRYLRDLTVFLAEVGCSFPGSCDWLGVSLGGLLGIRMAGLPSSPIRNLILSDIGPDVPCADLDMIRFYLSLSPTFGNPGEVLAAFRQTTGTGFSRGEMTEEQWSYYAATHVKQREDGMYTRNFDPAIATMFDKEPLGPVPLWPFWERITQPVLALRGALSTLFPEDMARKMVETKQGKAMRLVTIKDCGHVPSLYPDEQIAILRDWLAENG